MEFTELFKPFAVTRPHMVKNKHGDWVEEFQTHIQGSGYIRLLSGSEVLVSEKHTFVSTHRLYTAIMDIKKGDRITQNGVTYSVIIPNPLIDNIMQVDLEVVE